MVAQKKNSTTVYFDAAPVPRLSQQKRKTGLRKREKPDQDYYHQVQKFRSLLTPPRACFHDSFTFAPEKEKKERNGTKSN